MNKLTWRKRLAIGAGVLGFAISIAMVPPTNMTAPASAASIEYQFGNLGPNIKSSSGKKPTITGGKADFYIVNHWYNIQTENVNGNVFQTSTTHGLVAEMNHLPAYNYFSLCWWEPITSGNWSPLLAQCMYYS